MCMYVFEYVCMGLCECVCVRVHEFVQVVSVFMSMSLFVYISV